MDYRGGVCRRRRMDSAMIAWSNKKIGLIEIKIMKEAEEDNNVTGFKR